MTNSSTAIPEARFELVVALRAASLHGFNEGIDNHFSVALPGDDDRFLLNRYGPHWSEIEEDDILVVDVRGKVLSGTAGSGGIPAFVIHCAVHQARPDARAVFHTHMPAATAVATLAGGLDTRLSQAAMYFHGSVETLPFQGLATAAEEGERIAAAINDATSVVLMQNHGALVVGRTVAEAWQRLYFLERACALQLQVQATGCELARVSEAAASETANEWRGVEEEAADALFAAVSRYVERQPRAVVA